MKESASKSAESWFSEDDVTIISIRRRRVKTEWDAPCSPSRFILWLPSDSANGGILIHTTCLSPSCCTLPLKPPGAVWTIFEPHLRDITSAKSGNGFSRFIGT